MFMGPGGLRPEKDSAGEVQQQPKTTDLTSRLRGRPTSNPNEASDITGCVDQMLS
jgi:hypothetical protein